jgi:hypothetical protein
MAYTFVVYVDESGDEGFRFGAGSSDWFVLSAVVTRRATDLAVTRLVDDVRASLNRPARKPLHFKDMRHEHRLLYVDRIAHADLRTISILVHKPSLQKPRRSSSATACTSRPRGTSWSASLGTAETTMPPRTQGMALRMSSSRTAPACRTTSCVTT